MRRFAGASAVFLVIGLALLVFGLRLDAPQWLPAHGVIMLAGCILIGIEAMHLATLARFRPDTFDRSYLDGMVSLYTAGAAALGLGTLLQPSGVFSIVAVLGWLALIAASVLSVITHVRSLPKRGESVVDMDADPLTKGDDASWKHVKFAHFFLPVGLLLLAIAYVMAFFGKGENLYVAGVHVVGIGYGLLSMYGIGHIWVPRFSGVPAIAAGAIKGELHSTLPSLILLPLGFALNMVGLIIAGGAFAFLGFFTYMGVLGANIMRNKSPTHRVTPEFVYIPWTFTGIFWLVSAVLMGIFLNAVPELLASLAPALQSIHVHAAFFGGIIQLLLGWLTRMLSGDQPPRFTGTMSASFYAFNIAVVAALWFLVTASQLTALLAVLLTLLALTLWARSMQAFIRPPPSRSPP